MNDIFKWVTDHPDVELMMTMHRDSFIVQLTHVDTRYRLKHAFYVEQMEPYILDVLYDELSRRIGQSVFMEEKMMANKDGEIKRSDNGICIYITPEEKDQLDAICEYFGISRSQFVRITSDVIHERVLMNNYSISFEDLEAIGKRHGVGYGTVIDLCNIYV